MNELEQRIADLCLAPGGPSVGEVLIAGLKSLGRKPGIGLARAYISRIVEIAQAERDIAVGEALSWPKDGKPRDCFGNTLSD